MNDTGVVRRVRWRRPRNDVEERLGMDAAMDPAKTLEVTAVHEVQASTQPQFQAQPYQAQPQQVQLQAPQVQPPLQLEAAQPRPASAPSSTPDSTPVNGHRPGDDLSERDRQILTFERQRWKYAGAKEQAIRDQFAMSATRYYQVLNALIDRTDALAFDPLLVKRLRRLRSSRQRARAARRVPGHPGGQQAGRLRGDSGRPRGSDV
jgi:uncharacterized protein DUF3263